MSGHPLMGPDHESTCCPTCGGFCVVPHPTMEVESLVCPDCEGYGTALAAKLRAQGYDLDSLDRDNPYLHDSADGFGEAP